MVLYPSDRVCIGIILIEFASLEKGYLVCSILLFVLCSHTFQWQKMEKNVSLIFEFFPTFFVRDVLKYYKRVLTSPNNNVCQFKLLDYSQLIVIMRDFPHVLIIHNLAYSIPICLIVCSCRWTKTSSVDSKQFINCFATMIKKFWIRWLLTPKAWSNLTW